MTHQEIFDSSSAYDPHANYGKVCYEVWRETEAIGDTSLESCIRWFMQFYRHKPTQYVSANPNGKGLEKNGYWIWGFENNVDRILTGEFEVGYQRTTNKHPKRKGKLEEDARTLGGHVCVHWKSCKELIINIRRILNGEINKDEPVQLLKCVNPLSGQMINGKNYYSSGYFSGTYEHLYYSVIATITHWKFHVGHSYLTPFGDVEAMRKWILFVKEYFPLQRFEHRMVGNEKPFLVRGMQNSYVRLEKWLYDKDKKKLSPYKTKQIGMYDTVMFNVMLTIYSELDSTRHVNEEINRLTTELLQENFLILGFKDKFFNLETYKFNNPVVKMFANAVSPENYAKSIFSPYWKDKFEEDTKGDAQWTKYKHLILDLINQPTLRNLNRVINFKPFIYHNSEVENLMDRIPEYASMDTQTLAKIKRLSHKLRQICYNAAHKKIVKYGSDFSRLYEERKNYLYKLHLELKNCTEPAKFLSTVDNFAMKHSKTIELPDTDIIDGLITGDIDYDLFKSAVLWYSKINDEQEAETTTAKVTIDKSITL